jgi:type I restriction enzyme, S subunit
MDTVNYLKGRQRADVNVVKEISVPSPPLLTQRKIAAILSAYDDLIENNTQRIQILEEMAQTLYRHWFVDYKFPGHEDVQIVDSALSAKPKGWDIVTLETVCDLVTDGAHRSPLTINGNGFPMASVKDMTPWEININTCRTISEDDYHNLVKANCKPLVGDVLIAKDGSYLKYIFVNQTEQDLVLLSSIAILRPNFLIQPHILSLYLKTPHVKARMSGYVSGVAIPRIVLKDFRQFPIVLPPKNIQDEFGYMVTPLFDLIYVLLKKNSILKAARDQLLPKLISGELDVSDRLGGKNGNNLSLPS